MNELTNTELAVLGLVAEGPKHGYQIEQDIALRGMREWTEIGFSSIYYVLNKLAAAGWLESDLPAAAAPAAAPGQRRGGRVGGPARRVYRVTEAGRQGLRAAVRRRLAHPRPRSGDFDLALANLPALAPGEVRAALQTCRAELRAQMEKVKAKQQADVAQAGQPLPPFVEALFDHSLALMAAELGWIDAYLESMRDGDETGLEKRL